MTTGRKNQRIRIRLKAFDHRLIDRSTREIVETARGFFAALQTGQYNGNLEASTAVAVVSLLRVITGPQPLQAYQRETGKAASPATLLEDLINALTHAIDELTRPIDAIKHQAKTVTVGMSRPTPSLSGPIHKIFQELQISANQLLWRHLWPWSEKDRLQHRACARSRRRPGFLAGHCRR